MGRRGHGRRLPGRRCSGVESDGAELGLAWLPSAMSASRACFDRIGWDADAWCGSSMRVDRELREVRWPGPLRVGNRDRRPRHRMRRTPRLAPRNLADSR